MSDERTIQRIADSINAIARDWGTYHARRLDWRGGYSPDSLPEHVSGSSEPGLPAGLRFDANGNLDRDELEKRVSEGWVKIKAHLATAGVALRGVESEMAFLVNATKRPEDPDPVYCANPGCPDNKVWSMMPGDRPQRSDRRCEACHKWYERKQYERGFKHYALDGEAS